MRAAIDSAGRLVVPKALREALGVKPGQILDLQVRDGRLEIEIAPTPMRLKQEGPAIFAVPVEPLPPLTADQVRDALEQIRR